MENRLQSAGAVTDLSQSGNPVDQGWALESWKHEKQSLRTKTANLHIIFNSTVTMYINQFII